MSGLGTAAILVLMLGAALVAGSAPGIPALSFLAVVALWAGGLLSGLAIHLSAHPDCPANEDSGPDEDAGGDE